MLLSILNVVFTVAYEICKLICTLMLIYASYLYIKKNR